MQIEKYKEPYLSRISKTWPLSIVCLFVLVEMYFDRPDIFPFLFVFVSLLLGLFLLADKIINKKPDLKYLTLNGDGIYVDGVHAPYKDIVKVEDQFGYMVISVQGKKPIKLRKSEFPLNELNSGINIINERAGLIA